MLPRKPHSMERSCQNAMGTEALPGWKWSERKAEARGGHPKAPPPGQRAHWTRAGRTTALSSRQPSGASTALGTFLGEESTLANEQGRPTYSKASRTLTRGSVATSASGSQTSTQGILQARTRKRTRGTLFRQGDHCTHSPVQPAPSTPRLPWRADGVGILHGNNLYNFLYYNSDYQSGSQKQERY